MTPAAPTLVFDGTCGICRTWVDYWLKLTGNRVEYRPYQEAAGDFPAIPLDDFKRAMTLIEPDGATYAGAAATFRLLTYARSRGGWWWAYRHVPGFASVSEAAYTYLSQHRSVLARTTRVLWGTPLEPECYEIVAWVFLRALGLIYLAAFYSLASQVLGLIGSAGILPLGDYLTAAHAAWGPSAYWQMPTLFWLGSGDTALLLGAWGGVALALLLTLGILVRPALIALFALYLSFVYAGQIFFSFQWDMLLVETGFLAIFLTGGSRIVVWLYRLLLFRFMFLAGVAKITSGDPTWASLTALDYHFWTQPLPSPLAWYAAQAPHWVHAAMTAATLALELGVAFMIFMPRIPRAICGLLILAFQLGIMITGSFNFFNLLTMALCLFLFDDHAMRHLLPQSMADRIRAHAARPRRLATALATCLALILVPIGANLVWQPLTGRALPLASTMQEAFAPLLVANTYGVFAVMTTTRPAIVIEGSDDGTTWREYELPYQSGPTDRALTWNIPLQPRLDWQLWFAALEGLGRNLWIENLMRGLLQGSEPILALFATNPFPGHPPKYVRAELYDYRFTDPATRARTGAIWVRTLDGMYFPKVALSDFADGPLKSAAPMPDVVPGPRAIRP
jgi:predicted DCC family thiol-disulfide oxidoreductase YuxK